MKLIKNFNKIIIVIALLIAIYLWGIFIEIDYNPNYVMKGHHDYAFRGYLLFIFYTIGWVLFLIGIIQLKCHLMGLNRLPLISIIYFGIIGYVFFLLTICGNFDSSIIKTGAFRKSINIVLPSLIVLSFSWTKYVKNIHLESKKNIMQKF